MTEVDAANEVQAEWTDLVVMDDVSGAVIVLTASGHGRGLALDRVMVFLADGVTLWCSTGFDNTNRLPELSWTALGLTQQVRLFARTTQDLEPSEHLLAADGRRPSRIPLTMDLSLAPLSMPVPRRRNSPDPGLAGSQMYRASASLATGSVIYQIGGQALVGRTRFSSRDAEEGVRLQAAFQDGSSMIAMAPGPAREIGPGAIQRHTVTEAVGVSALRVNGPQRRIPTGIICQLEDSHLATVFGGYRSLDQHLAFVQPAKDRQAWVRRAYTPFDFRWSGVTGFGVLEQVGLVPSPDAPSVVGTGIPETF